MQWLTYLNPRRYYLVVIRGVFLRGAGFRILWQHMLARALLGPATLAMAAGRFRKTMA